MSNASHSCKMILTRFISGITYKIASVNTYRNMQTTQVLGLRVGEYKSRRVGRSSENRLFRQRLMKDSDFVDVNDKVDEGDSNPSADIFEEAYEKQVREFKDKTKTTRKIMMKKLFHKRPKEPNMLTFNERQHIMFLHRSDPVEWNAEHLSQSFPALPWVINKILKNKWIPENEEKMKMMDEAVLQNWKKLKEGKLEASPELLDHLKKFIDKRDNLEIQLKNPKFFQLPEVKKKLEWKSGHLNNFLLKYEKEVERLKGNSLIVKTSLENVTSSVCVVEEPVELATIGENENCKESLLLDEGMKVNPQFQKRKRERPVTLQRLKQDIFQKTENEKYLISPSEDVIVQKTIAKHDRSEPEIYKSDSGRRRILPGENELKSPETSSTLSRGIRDKIPEEARTDLSRESASGRGRRKDKLPSEGENLDGDTEEYEAYPNTFKITELGSKLFRDKDGKGAEAPIVHADEEENVDVQTKTCKQVQPVNYFNTEKDRQIYENHEKLLSETVFWNSRKRSRSLDAGFAAVNTALSPHIPSHIKTYFTYDYPLKIEIPQNKREKGKLYKVKDCYYDDTGKFLYRVPGMTE